MKTPREGAESAMLTNWRLGALALCLTMVASCPAIAQQSPSLAPPTYPVVIDTRTKTDASQAAFAELAKKADRQGKIRVIVGLNVDLPDYERSPEPQRTNDLQRLRDTQRGVIERGAVPGASVTLFETMPYLSAFVTAPQLARLARDPEVVSIQEDVPDLPGALPAGKNRQPMLADSLTLIGAPQVWARGITGNGQVIALLDTGVDFSHPMLKGKVLAGLCRSTADIPFYESFCPKGATSANTRQSARPCSVPGCESGTGSASVIAGNDRTLKGVAPDAKIISAQVFSKQVSYCYGDIPCPVSFWADQISALERIYLLRQTYNIAAVVLNVTGQAHGGPCEKDARAVVIRRFHQANIPTIVVSGSGSALHVVTAPGCISQAVTVGATTGQDLIWAYSPHSLMVDLMAPGENIYAAVPGGGYAYWAGTGIAASHLAGAIALLRQFRPEATVYQLISALRHAGVPVDRRSLPTGSWPTGITQLRIDVAKALTLLEETLPAAAKFPTVHSSGP